MTQRVLLPLLNAGPRGVPAPAAGCNCATCPFYLDNPDAIEPVCSGSNPECEYCACARAEAVTDARPRATACGTCPIRCGSRIDITAWMADIGSTLSFRDLTAPGALPAGLPHFIPQVDGSDIPGLDADLRWGAYAVGLRRVISPATARVYPKFTDTTAHAALGLRPDQRAVLVGYSEDPLIEALWTNRRTERTAERLAAMGWDLVLAPNTSLYANQPRAENLINMRRNLMLAAELAAAGVPTAPCVYWLRLEDLERYIDWVAAQRVRPAALAVNLQTCRTESDWQVMTVPGLAYLAAQLPEDLPVVLTGASRAARIAVLRELFGERLYLISQNALQYARHGAQMTDAGRINRHARTEDLFAANVRHYAQLAGVASAPAGGSAPDTAAEA